MQIELPSWAGQLLAAIITAIISATGGFFAAKKEIKIPEFRYVLAWAMFGMGLLGLGTNGAAYVAQVFQLYSNFPETLPYWAGWGTGVSVLLMGGGSVAYYAK